MSTNLINSADDQYFHELVSGDSQVVFRVPAYQREYSWGKQQWDDLYTDVVEEGSDDGHFLGTIICVNDSKNSTKEVVLELIDGQQRMTTLSLLLIALFVELNARRAAFRDDDDRNGTFISLKKQLVLNGIERLRPQRQGFNLPDYRWILKSAGLLEAAEYHKWHGVRRMAKAYKFFADEIRAEIAELDADEQLERLFAITRQIRQSILVKLEVSSHASAFVLFESLNNRGMELSPIDLIKNTLLMRAEQASEASLESTYQAWTAILGNLGDSYTDQERFLRYYYNAFQPVRHPGIAVPTATKSNLIRLYEEYLGRGIEAFLEDLEIGSTAYGRLIGNEAPGEPVEEPLASRFRSLARAQGSPGYILLMYLMVHQDRMGLQPAHLAEVARWLTNFFVRRNLTGYPQTYALTRLFQDVIEEVRALSGGAVVDAVRASLARRSRTREEFQRALEGDIYTENTDMTRFILSSLAEHDFTNEFFTDLWARGDDGKHLTWTIEHIFPEGEKIPQPWIDMMGGASEAADAFETLVHKLGNLTLTGYNSSLGNKGFIEKRDRKGVNGSFVGYKNGFSLNVDLRDRDDWNATAIVERGRRLVREALALFDL